jgi:hypothetical protein
MSPVRLVGGFLLRFAIVYAALAVLWPGLGDAYAGWYRSAGEYVFRTIGSGGEVLFKPVPVEGTEFDTILILGNANTKAVTEIKSNSRIMGFVPTCFVLALTLATPIPWKRRLRAVVIGGVLVQVYVGFRVWITLLGAFSGENDLSVFAFGPTTTEFLSFTFSLLVVSLAGCYVVPALIWAVVTFRRSDLQEFQARNSPAT